MPIAYPLLPNRRTYAVIGTGALGGFYGARLQQAGCEVHFLLRSDYETVRQQGLVVKSIDGDFTLPQVYAYQDVSEMPACDVVIVALKTTQNDWLPQLLPPIVKPDGVVLVLQNGLGIEPNIEQLVGSVYSEGGTAKPRVMGGLCFLCSNKIAPGVIHHVDYKQITLGDYADGYAPCGITDRQKQIAQDFEQAGIPIVQSEDLLMARWKKLMWNIPFNGLSVVLDATTDRLMADSSARQLSTALMQEVLDGANACLKMLSISDAEADRAIPADFIQTMLDYTEKMKPYRTSMKLDYDDRRPLEVEAIFGNPLRMAQAAGLRMPRVEMLYQQLKFLDGERRSV